jgi:hypothetical protein
MLGQQFFGNTRNPPRWLADFGSRSPGPLLPWPAKIDASQFTDMSGVPVVVTAIAAIGATTVAVAALTPGDFPNTNVLTGGSILIPAGTVLDFGGGKFARLTVSAKYGDTALTVSALPTALAVNDTARYNSLGPQSKFIRSGILVGRTLAERDAGTPYGAPDVATPDDELFLIAFDVPNTYLDNDIVLVKQQSNVKENYLPNYDTVLAPAGVASATLLKIRTLYRCIKGVD